MERCTRCVMPETVPGISFDSDGVCSFCLSYKKEVYFGEDELIRIINSAKEKKNKYDCVVPLSGGRDSSFVLYAAKVLYGLKVLAVSYDNEFRNEQALVNMRKACVKLNVKFISVRSKINIAKKIVRSSVRCSISDGICQIAGRLCGACAYGYRSVVYRAAEKYNVPLILWGESQAEKTMEMQKMITDRIEKLAVNKQANKKFHTLFNLFRLLQRLEFPVPGNSVVAYPALKNKNIKEIRLFDYIVWDRNKITSTITKELGWEKPSGAISTWRIDCKLHHFMNYCFFKMFGCSKDCFGYSNMINSGKMDRQDALRQEEQMLATYTRGVKELLRNEIGLTEKETAAIEAMPSLADNR